jgi:hypothetical protein
MPASPRILSLALLALLTPLAPATAFAAAATASQEVNLRSGPATSYDVIGQLPAGQAVDVRQCEGKFCQVAYEGKTGWVSSSFLTRGAASGEPQTAAIVPTRPTPAANASPSAILPPAYSTTPPTANVADNTNDEDFSAPDAPRPRMDVPGARTFVPGDDDDMASTDNSGDDDAFATDDGSSDDNDSMAPPPDFGPRGFGPRGFRRDFAGLNNGPDRACLIDAEGGSGFCIREGERIDMPGRWAGHTMLLRNPQRLNVTVCTVPDDCRTYLASGPVLVGGRTIASISVAEPGY